MKKYLLVCAFVYAFSFTHATDARLFPDIPGWKKKLAETVYTPDNLWELINGAADIFLSYYFQDLQMAEYENKDEMIRVEIYRHKTGNDTYGIYSAERMPDYPQVKIGSQGYKSQGVLNFFAGNFYVKVMSAGVRETDESTIAMVAEKVNAALDQKSLMPEVLNLFPEEGKVFLSDSYIAQNFMGYSFMNRAFVTKYEKPAEFQMFIIYVPGEAQNMLDQYINLVKKENVTESDGILVLKDQFNGTVFIKKHNDYLIGVVNTENSEIAKDFISKTIEKI